MILSPLAHSPVRPFAPAAGVLLTFGMGLFFIVFDFCSRRYAARVHHAATIATAHHATDREKIRGRHAFVAMVRDRANGCVFVTDSERFEYMLALRQHWQRGW